MKRVLALMLIMMMVPLCMGLTCPCASADESAVEAQAAIEAVPCHGCCPEIDPGPQQLFDQNPSVTLRAFFSKVLNVLKAPNPGMFQEIADNRRAHAPAGGEPLVLSPQPRYLTLEVFRI